MSGITEVQRKLIQINLDWCKLEETTGEHAALEVACQQNGVEDSQWFYAHIMYGNNAEVLNRECTKIWDERKSQ